MRDHVIAGLFTACAAALAVVALLWWLNLGPEYPVEPRIPSARDIEEAKNVASSLPLEVVNIEGLFRASNGVPSNLPGAWPRFRGAQSDNICTDTVSLAESWPAEGPPVLWSVPLGDGYAGAAVLKGCIYLLDYDEKERADTLRCLSLEDGREIWRRGYKVEIKRNHGMSRTVPAVTEKYTVTLGPRCHVLCVRSTDGSFLWGLDLARDFGATVPLWYTGQCPLIDGTTAVLAPGGKCLLMGVDCETGKVLWETPNPHGWKMSHSSIIPFRVGDRRAYLYCAIGGMAAISAEEKDRGTVLWETTEWNNPVTSPSPVPLGDGRILVTAGYGAGSAMFEQYQEGSLWKVRRLFTLDRRVFACEQHTPILWQGRLYSVLTSDAEELKRQFVCMTPDGKVAWSSGKENRFGLGPFMLADGKFFILSDDGVLTLARASASEYIPLAKARVLTNGEAWGPMALVNGRLLLRDLKRMICLDVRARR